MFTDKLLHFCEAKAIAGPGSYDADDVIDLKAAGQLGNGRPLEVVIRVDVAADAGNSDETYSFAVTTDDNSGLTSDTTVASKTIARTALTANSLHVIPIPQGVATERYLGLVATTGGTTPSITITAWLARQGSTPDLVTYPNAYDV